VTASREAEEISGSSARSLVSQARSLRIDVVDTLAAPEARRSSARRAYEVLRRDVVQRHMATMPLTRIRETTQGRLRLTAIEKAGYSSVGAVAAAGQYQLQSVPGVGPQTATQVIAAARQLQSVMEQEARIRFDPDARTKLQTALLGELRAYETAKALVSRREPDLKRLAVDLDSVLDGAGRASSRFKMFFSLPRKKAESRAALAQLAAVMSSPTISSTQEQLTLVLRGSAQGERSLWDDFQARAVTYNGLLIEVGELATDEEASRGFVPSDIAQRVHEHPLDVSLMKSSLRGYQAFGAKFALVQERAIIGDEMGLGKTVQALAVACHLHMQDVRHFLVVCPASVIVNWTREVQAHTQLQAYRLHGPDLARNQQTWTLRGGIAVTTYDALRTMPVPDGIALGMLVVDEAHYAKNPAAARTKAVVAWSARTRRVLFLTGTPMQNRVDEFQALVGHLRPELAYALRGIDGAYGGTAFRKAVAPVYLRRDQSDVLSELPPRLEMQDWVEMEGAALHSYREAVFAGNFMAMRRAAFAPGDIAGSAKLRRLTEIVEEAASNGRKVIVYSFFREVLQTIVRTLGESAIGPLNGSVNPAGRQAMVDQFSERQGPAVLVSQVQAGGVGLNIQAASVVILTEPQWNPAAEEQAIARCHRMGQVRVVDVHRLLGENSVDQRMLEILRVKADLFDEYARRSEIKDVSPDAVDITDMAAAKQMASQVEAERRILDMERKRLLADSRETGDSL
jgi:SNF2 family DNA or RNA helicase